MSKLQVYPSVPLVVYMGVEVTDATVLDLLPKEWLREERILVGIDGTIHLGLNPARKFEGGTGLGLMDEIAKHPAVAKALADHRAERVRRAAEAEAKLREAHLDAVHPMAVIAKGGSKLYFMPGMIGFEGQVFDPAAGDRLYSRARDAERDGYTAGAVADEAPKPRKRKGK